MATKRPSNQYPKAGPVAGKLLRRMVKRLRDSAVELPLDSHILIGCSGGADSVALASLLVRFGRRIALRQKIKLVHINHRWRGKESDQDAEFVRQLAKQWDVGFELFELDPPVVKTGRSPEESARSERKKIFARLAQKENAWVFTAHHADDLAETLLWRLFTGSSQTHGGGILVRDGIYLRPLLGIRKQELIDFLREQKQSWREDRTNSEGRLMRSKMRQELMPLVEKLFPKAVERLVELGLANQKNTSADGPLEWIPQFFFQNGGQKFRRENWDTLRKLSMSSQKKVAADLPGGWKVTAEHEPRLTKSKTVTKVVHNSAKNAEKKTRWVIEHRDSSV